MAEILVLEDMDAFRRVVTQALSDDGHTVTGSESGQIVYEQDVIANADLMITDLNMPWVNGIEAILLAKKVKPDLKIIAMSGGSETLKEDYLLACLVD